MFEFNLIRFQKNRHCGPSYVLLVLILKEKLVTRVLHLFVFHCKGKIVLTLFGNHIFPCSDWKKFQSPVGACLKRLISNPDMTFTINNEQTKSHSTYHSLTWFIMYYSELIITYLYVLDIFQSWWYYDLVCKLVTHSSCLRWLQYLPVNQCWELEFDWSHENSHHPSPKGHDK